MYYVFDKGIYCIGGAFQYASCSNYRYYSNVYRDEKASTVETESLPADEQESGCAWFGSVACLQMNRSQGVLGLPLQPALFG